VTSLEENLGLRVFDSPQA